MKDALPATATFERNLIRKIMLRTIPLLGLMYIVSFLDRVNIGYAALTMNKAIGISAEAYGWAAGIFFLGYVLFQIPANLVMVRLGARRWMAAIMLVWGFVAGAMAMVGSDTGLIAARFLLGVAEAGFFPGAILYLTLWFPPAQRGKITANFMFAAPIAYIIGSPISGLILKGLDGWYGIAGWQWLFMVEALPAIFLAPIVWKYLPGRPEEAAWLSGGERAWLTEQMAAQSSDARALPATGTPPLLRWPVIGAGLSYFGMQVGVYGIGLWLPQIIAVGGLGPLATGIVGAIPYLFAVLGMALWGRRTEGRAARASDVWLPLLAAGVFLALGAFAPTFALSMSGLTVMTACVFAALPMFWAYSTSAYGRLLGPAGIAMVNALGSMGGFSGPILVGWVKTQTASYVLALLSIAAIMALSGLLIASLGWRGRPAEARPTTVGK